MGGRALVRRVVLGATRDWTKPRAQNTSETSQEPAPGEEQDPRDQEPPADLNTGNRPANEGGNLIFQASSRGRGNGLQTRCPTGPPIVKVFDFLVSTFTVDRMSCTCDMNHEFA